LTWFYLAGANAPAFLVSISLEIDMQTSILTIRNEPRLGENVPRTFRPFEGGPPRDVEEVIIRKEFCFTNPSVVAEAGVELQFSVVLQSLRKNGRPEVVRPYSRMHDPREIEKDRLVFIHADYFYDFVLRWLLACEYRLANASRTTQPTLCTIPYDTDIATKDRELHDAVIFVRRFITDTQRHMKALGLEVSIGF
jgi:hypothetical protein